MWEALIATKKDDPVVYESDKRYRPNSRMSKIRALLKISPHQTAYQVAKTLGITQVQAHVALCDMAKRRDVSWALDASSLRNRQTKHYSLS